MFSLGGKKEWENYSRKGPEREDESTKIPLDLGMDCEPLCPPSPPLTHPTPNPLIPVSHTKYRVCPECYTHTETSWSHLSEGETLTFCYCYSCPGYWRLARGLCRGTWHPGWGRSPLVDSVLSTFIIAGLLQINQNLLGEILKTELCDWPDLTF